MTLRPYALALAVLVLPLIGHTEGVPRLVKDINAQSCDVQGVPCGSFPDELVEAGDTVFFRAFEPGTGSELWQTDGTEEGTFRVADINPGPGSSDPSQLVYVNGTLFFIARDANNTLALWKSAGTPDGTMRVANTAPIPPTLTAPRVKAVHGGVLLSDGLQLWATDGSAEHTSFLGDFRRPDISDLWQWGFTEIGDEIFFTLCDHGGDCELWKSDRTALGTRRVAVITPPYRDPALYGSPGGQPSTALLALTNWDGALFFAACQFQGLCDLWKSDGTAEGTVRILEFNPSQRGDDWSAPAIALGNHHLLFPACNYSVTGCELWTSDGSGGGTHIVADISPGPASSFWSQDVQNFVVSGDLLFFVAHVGLDSQLWRTDGTEAGTVPLSTHAGSVSEVGNTVIFGRSDDEGTGSLWRTDGTLAGTAAVTSGDPALSPQLFVKPARLGQRLLFRAVDYIHGEELWSVSLEGGSCADGSCPGDDLGTTTSTVTTTSTSTSAPPTNVPSTSTSVPTYPTTTLPVGASPCRASRLVRRVDDEINPVLGCRPSGGPRRWRQERRLSLLRRKVAASLQHGGVSDTCASYLLGLLQACSVGPTS